MNRFYLLIKAIILSFIFNTFFCNEEKEVKYIITEINSKYPYKNETNYFYDDYSQNYLFAKIKLGSNEQVMEMKVDLNLYETYISKKDIVNTELYTPYEVEHSKTFNTSKRFYSQKGEFTTALLAKDTLIVNNGQKDIKLDNFYFAYADDGYNKFAGSIGFNLLKSVIYPEESMNFIDQLKNHSIISGYSLTIQLTSKYNGNLLIGADLEDIMPKEIETYSKYSIKVNGYISISEGKWEVDLNKVLVGNSELLYSKKLAFDLKSDFILATDEYSEFIFKNFFSPLFGENKCIKKELESYKYYLGIKCQKNVDLKNFPNLDFDISSDFEKNHLVLDYEDLFEEIGEYKYFKIIITSNPSSKISINNNWVFGKEFFRANLVTFNKERRDIIIYVPQKERKEDEENSKSKTFKAEIWLLILIIILIIMLGVIIYLLIICIKQGKLIKRKKRINHLLEDEYNNINY